MILRVVNHKFHYETENLCRVFFPYETIRVINDESDETDDITVVTSMSGEYVVGVSVNINGATGEKKKTVADYDDCEREMAILLFSLLSEITGYVPKWGILTGVRPSKLMNSLIKDYGDNGAKAYFTDKLLVCKNKTELAYSVAKAEEKIMSLSDEKASACMFPYRSARQDAIIAHLFPIRLHRQRSSCPIMSKISARR